MMCPGVESWFVANLKEHWESVKGLREYLTRTESKVSVF